MVSNLRANAALTAVQISAEALVKATNLVAAHKIDLDQKLNVALIELDAAKNVLKVAIEDPAADPSTSTDSAIEAAAKAMKVSYEASEKAGVGSARRLVFEEWKECRFSIDRFDKILVDLRKTGFGFVTVLVSAAAYVFTGKHQTENAAIAAMIALLVTTLYLFDYKHQVWLRETVIYAKSLETELGYKLTTILSDKFDATKSGALGLWLYVILLAMSSTFFWIAVSAHEAGLIAPHKIVVGVSGFVGLVTMVLVTQWGWGWPVKNWEIVNKWISIVLVVALFVLIVVASHYFPANQTPRR